MLKKDFQESFNKLQTTADENAKKFAPAALIDSVWIRVDFWECNDGCLLEVFDDSYMLTGIYDLRSVAGVTNAS